MTKGALIESKIGAINQAMFQSSKDSFKAIALWKTSDLESYTHYFALDQNWRNSRITYLDGTSLVVPTRLGGVKIFLKKDEMVFIENITDSALFPVNRSPIGSVRILNSNIVGSVYDPDQPLGECEINYEIRPKNFSGVISKSGTVLTTSSEDPRFNFKHQIKGNHAFVLSLLPENFKFPRYVIPNPSDPYSDPDSILVDTGTFEISVWVKDLDNGLKSKIFHLTDYRFSPTIHDSLTR